jgi:hypothetical protein
MSSVAVLKVWTELARECDCEPPGMRNDVGGDKPSVVGASAMDGIGSEGTVAFDDDGEGWRGLLPEGSGVRWGLASALLGTAVLEAGSVRGGLAESALEVRR